MLTIEMVKRRVAETFPDAGIEVLEYHRSDYPVQIKCKAHGKQYFSNLYNLVTSTRGCPVCAEEDRVEKLRDIGSQTSKVARRLPDEVWIQRFVDRHGDRYEYITPLRRSKNMVEVRCKEHGTFYVRPRDHANGIICPDCSRKRST